MLKCHRKNRCEAKISKDYAGEVHKLAGKLWETKWVSGKTGGGRADAPRGMQKRRRRTGPPLGDF